MSDERWSQLRLVVHRNHHGTLDWTLVHRDVRGAQKWDRRLGWGQLLCEPGSEVSQDALSALAAALEAAHRVREGR